jgi:hypothetical protein
MNPIRFEPHQLAELEQLGVVPEAINQLETEALPLAQEFLERQPAHTDVRDELQAVADALAAARHAVERLLNAKRAVPHLIAARSRIAGGGRRNMTGGMRLAETSQSLATAIEVVAAALGTVPDKARRHPSASAMPIKYLHMALQRGSIMAGHDPLVPALKPSSSVTSAFRRVIGICYEAIGEPSTDPERAIKAHVKNWRAQQDYAERLRLGQNPPEKSEVLS